MQYHSQPRWGLPVAPTPFQADIVKPGNFDICFKQSGKSGLIVNAVYTLPVFDLTETLQQNVPLSEMLTTLKQELAVAMEKGRGDAIELDVTKAEVEVAFVATRSKEGGGGVKVKFWVVTAEGKIVHHDLRESMTEADIEFTLQRAHEKGPVRNFVDHTE